MVDVLDVGGQDRISQTVLALAVRHCRRCEIEAREWRCFVCGRWLARGDLRRGVSPPADDGQADG